MIDAQLVSNIIYGIQALLGVLAIHAILYRLIAIDTRILTADNCTFFRLASQVQQGTLSEEFGRVDTGWLRWVRDSRSKEQLASRVETLYSRSQAYLPILAMVAAIETLFGLLGTVAGFIVSESIDSMSLSIAFGTTFWGIVASLPPTFYLYCSESFRNRIHFQMQTLLEAATQSVPMSRSSDLETPAKPMQDSSSQKNASSSSKTISSKVKQGTPHNSKPLPDSTPKSQPSETSSSICTARKASPKNANDSEFALSLIESVSYSKAATESKPTTFGETNSIVHSETLVQQQ